MVTFAEFKKFYSGRRSDFLICLVLATVTFIIYWQVQNYSFVNYDDPMYITKNPNVLAGFTLEGIGWSFTKTPAYWHPLTWISHMLDVHLYGLSPGQHHRTNLWFHIANTLILFISLKLMTGQLWPSAFVAALFALHPLHVESVAWISERKDVLSTFFWMLTMLSYAWYVKRPYYKEGAGILRYLCALLCFLLGLMSKPMLVTVPFVLLLLDYWPLRRFSDEGFNSAGEKGNRSITRALIWEKVPFLVLSTTLSISTIISGKATLSSLEALSIKVRLFNAAVSYVKYLWMMIWPFNLSVIYPHPGEVPGGLFASALLILVGILALALKTARQAPYFITGWLWYIGTLVPVIGITQSGSQALADRFTYIPLVGIFIIIAWGAPNLLPVRRYKNLALGLAGLILLIFFTVVTWFQLKVWTNSITLFENALNVNPNNSVAHNNLGNALEENKNLSEAIEHYQAALRLEPDTPLFHRNLARALAAQGKIELAIEHYSRALQLYPGSASAHFGLGLILDKQDRVVEAIYHYSEATRLEPFFADAHHKMGLALIKTEEVEKAIYHLKAAVEINPDLVDANMNLKKAMSLRENIN